MFQPNNREEINTMRVYLNDTIPNFNQKHSNLWLGFVRPRDCHGIEQLPGLHDFSGQWLPGYCKRGAAMNLSIFQSLEPNNRENKEHCTLCPHEVEVWDVNCEYEDKAYAVCEVNLDDDDLLYRL